MEKFKTYIGSFMRCWLAVSLTLLSVHDVRGEYRSKREMRGVWVATVWGIDWPSCRGTDTNTRKRQQQELTAILDRCKRINLTTVCFQVRGMSDVLFRSRIEPWSAAVSGKRGTDPGWDPLEWMVKECHDRGLECYAWVNPFRWSSGTDYDSAHDRELKRKGWLLTHGKYTALNPGLEEVRTHITEVCREIVDGYDVDGLVFDDYFYPNRIPEGVPAPDYELYLSQAPWMSHGDWRRANVNKLIADIHCMIADTRPGVRFGISPAGVSGKAESQTSKWGTETLEVKADDWQYNEIYSDPIGWLYQGTIDFVSPQIYWPTSHATAPYAPIAGWWSRTAAGFGRHLYNSVTLERIAKGGEKREHSDELLRQIEHNRSASIDGCQGTIIYSAKFLPDVEKALSWDHYSFPSLTPRIHSHESKPESPTGLRLTDGVLSWRQAEGARRYTVYAVPDEVTREQAADETGDGIDGAFLLGVTYHPQMEVGEEKGYRYAVCVYTDYSAEGPAAWLE